MYLYIYTHIYTYRYIFIYIIYIYAYIHVYIYIQLYVCTHINLYTTIIYIYLSLHCHPISGFFSLDPFAVEGTVTKTSTDAECSTCEAGGGGNTTSPGAMTMQPASNLEPPCHTAHTTPGFRDIFFEGQVYRGFNSM